MKYVLSLDSGTTSTRATLFDVDGNKLIVATRPLNCQYPKPGYVSQDPMEIYLAAFDVINEVLTRTGISLNDILGIGLTSQRETTLLFDKKSQQPLTEAIVWQSNETDELAKSYMEYEDLIKERTGLTISPYFSSSKIRLLLDKYGLQERAELGEIGFATIDSWIIYKLTEGRGHYTDMTNASRTGLFNIHTCEYDNDLLAIYNIPKKMLPIVLDSTSYFGETKLFNKGSIKILGDAGDQQAALLGHRIVTKGGLKMTYGTGLFALLHTGEKAVSSKHGLLTTIALSHQGKTYYALEGSVFIGGAAVGWLRDKMEMIKDYADSEYYSFQAKNEGVVVVPAFVGLGTPYWDSECQGAIFGITRNTSKNDIIKATLEGIGFEAYDVMKSLEEDAGIALDTLYVDGGASVNNYLMQFQSDILGLRVLRPYDIEMTSLGAFYLVLLNTGRIPSIADLVKLDKPHNVYTPKMDEKTREMKVSRYHKAVEAARVFK